MKKAKKNLLWFYLRCPDILLREVSCNIIKGDAIQREDPTEREATLEISEDFPAMVSHINYYLMLIKVRK